MKTKTIKIIEVSDWDDMVSKTYGRPYCFQQQNDCQDRVLHKLPVPDEETYDFENDTILEVVNSEEMGVSFKAWLERDPKTPILDSEYEWETELWWDRNFYPDVQMIANDLHAKGLLEAGEYGINIDQ